MRHPSSYSTLAGLLRATEKVLAARLQGQCRFAGQSAGMWLFNASFIASEKFGSDLPVRELQSKYAITRRQDLLGGDACFGVALPTRDYIEGDNIPGVGRVDEVFGDQLRVGSQWFHKRCFEQAAG